MGIIKTQWLKGWHDKIEDINRMGSGSCTAYQMRLEKAVNELHNLASKIANGLEDEGAFEEEFTCIECQRSISEEQGIISKRIANKFLCNQHLADELSMEE